MMTRPVETYPSCVVRRVDMRSVGGGGGDRMQLDSDADGIAILLIIIIATVSEFIKVIQLRCKVVGI